MQEEVGCEFDVAIFDLILSNIEDHQKVQNLLRGVIDCVNRWGRAGQLPFQLEDSRKQNGDVVKI